MRVILEQIAYDPAYPAHRPKTITDASGRVTSFTYNSAGQVLTITNAKSETTTFTYDAGHNLINIAGPVAGATMALTYDGYGRPRTVTDSEGYTLTQDYDALNRPTVTTYPDGTYEQNIYNVLDVGWRKDRLDRWTTFSHNSVRNLTAVEDPLGRTTRYGYCVCGALVSLTDPAGNTTGWDRDLEERPEAKIFADGTKQLYAYDLAGRLASLTDAKGQVTNYTYNIDNTLKQKAYAHAQNPTAPVSFAYDPNYQRVVTMTDGTGTSNYTYNSYSTAQPPATTTGAGRLATESGPLANAVIAYGYDELGRVNATSIDGANNSATQTYDSLGRINGITNPLGAFTYSYLNATKRLSSITYPNSQVTNFSYFGNTGDQRLQEISNLTPAGATLSKFDYTYNAVGNIPGWQQQTDANTPGIYNYQYDAADQLTSATLTNTISNADLHHYGYGYDAAGNRTGEQIDSQVNSATPNKLNQLTATQGGGPLQFSGTLDQPATVTVGGNPATVSGNTFTGYANVTPGNNQVVVSATSVSGQTTNHTFQVTATGSAPQAFNYDPNGNTLSDGTKAYEWDAQNRLTAINYVGTQNRSEFKYDGLDRRVAIIEKANGTITSTKNFVWTRAMIAEERDANDALIKRFYPQGEQIGGEAYFFASDHLGSVRELTDSSGAIRARYDYDPCGRSTKTAGDLDADFGFTGDYIHATSKLNLTLYRAYSPSIARWLSRDPIGENGGINLYAYVGNSPTNRIDPDGRLAIGAIIGAVIGGVSGGIGAYLQGGSAFDVALSVGLGAGAGLLLGAIDPTEGFGAAAMFLGAGGALGAFGDMLGQGIGMVGKRMQCPTAPINMNWGEVAGAGVGG